MLKTFILVFLAQTALSHLNLFISKEEMSRTLGMSAELAYIEDGAVNGYSTKFPYRVDLNVTQVKFSWNANQKVDYSLSVSADDVAVLPVLRIARTGVVPFQTQEFAVEYRCAGNKAGQFEVSLYINLTYPNGNVTKLRLRQEKLCAARDGRRFLGGAGADGLDSSHTEEDGFVTAEQIVYVIVGCAAAFLALIAFLLIFYFRSTKKDTSTSTTPIRSRIPGSFRSSRTTQSHQPFLTSTPNKSVSTEASRFRGVTSSSTSHASNVDAIVQERANTVDVKNALVELYTDRNLIQMLPFDELQGTFGELKWAIWRQTASGTCGDIDEEEDAGTGDEAILVKTLKSNASRQQFEKFLSDALVFYNVPPHANLAQVCSAATFGRFENPETVTDFPLLGYRHRGFGILKKFLLSCRSDGSSSRDNACSSSVVSSGGQTLRTHELVSMAIQICRAMVHLHKYGIIHKDIATRNCIVAEMPGRKSSDRLHLQLCDNALSKDLFPSDYHCLGDNENRPICWMPPEALATNVYNSATDIWSYGVTLWELLSCGAQPLNAVDPDDIQSVLLQGARPPQPYNCPDQMYNLMLRCWAGDPRERPTGEQILNSLQEFTQQLRQFI